MINKHIIQSNSLFNEFKQELCLSISLFNSLCFSFILIVSLCVLSNNLNYIKNTFLDHVIYHLLN